MTDEAQGAGAAAKRWWQWFLLYPTFGVAVVSAAPGVADKALAVLHGTETESYSEGVRQQEMWLRNVECARRPFTFHSRTGSVRVDASVCPSGDLFVRAVTADSGTFYRWIALEEVIAPVAAAGGGGLIPAARAAPAPAAAPRPAPVRLAMNVGEVICQRPVDAKVLVRRIRTANGCIDEFVNMYSGAVIERRPAPCLPQC